MRPAKPHFADFYRDQLSGLFIFMEHYEPLISAWKDDITKYAKQIHAQMHEFAVRTIYDDPSITYQEAVNMFFCLREAERIKREFNAQDAADLRYWMKHQDEFKH